MEKYCRNCNNFGHRYHECNCPILSYGIILFKRHDNKDDNKNDNIKIIMIEKKDTLSYVEFMRGRYNDINNIEYIISLIDRFSNDEKNRILKYKFDELWNKLWIDLDNINNKIKREYHNSNRMFNKLKYDGVNYKGKNIKLKDIIKSSKTDYNYNEWEIPKGRRENYESNMECSIREFYEETNISQDKYNIIFNILPLIEEYIGTNNVFYRHLYYIGELIDYDIDVKMDNKNTNQIKEIKNIKWMNEDECYKHIRNYDKNKSEIIRKFFRWIKLNSEYGEVKK